MIWLMVGAERNGLRAGLVREQEGRKEAGDGVAWLHADNATETNSRTLLLDGVEVVTKGY